MLLKLDDLELIKRVDEDGKVQEIRSIRNLSISGRKRIVELQIPGSAGNVFQDMGREPLRIFFEGELVGPGTMETLQNLKSKFEVRNPIPFSSDITTISDITEVIIDDFAVHFVGGLTNGSRYSIVLKEHKSSSTGGGAGPGETEPPNQEESARKNVEEKTAKIFEGSKSASG
jgi:hypothetical protein